MISRRRFIQGLAVGLAAAPFSTEAMRVLFGIDYTGDDETLQRRNTALTRGELGRFEGVRIICRHAVSLGSFRDCTNDRIQRAKILLVDWVKRKRITTNPRHIRFCYQIDDFCNEVGIGIMIFSHPVDIGLTWGQTERLLKREVQVWNA